MSWASYYSNCNKRDQYRSLRNELQDYEDDLQDQINCLDNLASDYEGSVFDVDSSKLPCTDYPAARSRMLSKVKNVRQTMLDNKASIASAREAADTRYWHYVRASNRDWNNLQEEED